MNIDPSIQVMNISKRVKQYFNKLEFYEIINDIVAVNNAAHEVNECMANKWSFSVNLKHCNIHDILEFYQAIINSRKKYLLDNNISLKMIFYTWYDEMSGNLCFSIIPQNWKKLLPNQELPFGCTLNKVEDLSTIIQIFVEDHYKSVIPIHEFTEAEYLKNNGYDPKKYTLNIWSIIL